MHLCLWLAMLAAIVAPGCHATGASGGAADARRDFERGHFALKSAGLRPINSAEADRNLLERYGIHADPAAG